MSGTGLCAADGKANPQSRSIVHSSRLSVFFIVSPLVVFTERSLLRSVGFHTTATRKNAFVGFIADEL